MQNKPNLREAQMNVSKVLTSGYENARLHRRGQNKPNQTQLQTQANGFFKILPRLPIITRILPGHWPACPIIQPAKDAEPPAVLVNLPLNPADRKNRNRLQAQNAQPFLIEKCRNQRPGLAGYIKGLKDE